MPAVASIALSIKANTQKLVTGLRRASKVVAAFGDRVRRVAKGIAKFGAAITAVAAAGITLFVKQSFTMLDALAKTSDKLGITTERLAGLHLAAKRTGVDVRKMNMGIQRMTRRLAEAAQGGGEAKAALAELGIDAVKVTRLPIDKQFAIIADAMEKVRGQSDRVRLGFKLFDSEGVALINTLRGGSVQLEKFHAEAERLGLTFSRFDLSRIERANDAIGRLRDAFRGIANQLAVISSTGLEGLADKMTNLAVNFRKMLVTKILPWVKGVAVDVLNVVDMVARSIGRMVAGMAADFTKALAHTPGSTGIAFARLHRQIVEGSGIFRAAHLGGKPWLGDRISDTLSGMIGKAQTKFLVDSLVGEAKNLSDSLLSLFRPLKRAIEPFVGPPANLKGGSYPKTAARQFAELRQISPTRFHIPGLAGQRGQEQLVRDPTVATKLACVIRPWQPSLMS
jgi:hypothetical protein